MTYRMKLELTSDNYQQLLNIMNYFRSEERKRYSDTVYINHTLGTYNPEREFYTVTRTCKDDMRAVFEDDKGMLDLIETITPTEMQWIATKLADDYIGQLYWESLGAIVKEVIGRRN